MRAARTILRAVAAAMLVAGPLGAQPLSVLSTDNTTADLGSTANGSSQPTGMSGDGRFVVFASDAKDVIPGQTSQFQQLFLFDQATGAKTLLSHAAGSATVGANAQSEEGRVSRNGRWVVFLSQATDLIAGQVDGGTIDKDVFLWDRTTGVTTLVSHVPGSSVTASDDGCFDLAISANGRFVAYNSGASDLVTGQTGTDGVFLYDRQSDTNVVVSHALAGSAVVRFADLAGLSDDGATVYFGSAATDLVSGYNQNNVGGDLFLFERAGGTVSLVSHAAGMPLDGQNSIGGEFAASADGNYALYSTYSTNLVAGFVDGNGPFERDVFLFDRAANSWTLVTASSSGGGTSADDDSRTVVLSADGSYGVIESDATDLVAGATDTNLSPDLFLYDRLGGGLTLVSHAAGMPLFAADRISDAPVLSPDGSLVAYLSAASDLVTGELKANGAFDRDVYLFDRATGENRLVDRIPAAALTTGNSSSSVPLVSDNGTVVFQSNASDLVADDLNNRADVFSNSTLVFSDGFESGDTSAWTSSSP